MGPRLGRACFYMGLAVLITASPCAAQDPALSRIAIIDASVNTTAHLAKLKDAGVNIIGRYFARCRQAQLPDKMIVASGKAGQPGSEIDAILDAGFAFLSIYQYYNNSALKFEGKRAEKNKIVFLEDANCETPEEANPPDKEAELDANAAVEQARMIGQPRGSAIYFGVDFNFREDDEATKANMLRYFRVVRRIVVANGYRLGAYGSGDANSVLRKERLVDLSWLSASRSFAGSSSFHRSGEWHLFQNWTDSHWFSERVGKRCTPGLELDTNIQNKRFAGVNIGFWSRAGLYKVPEERTTAIFDQHRFVCNGRSLIRADALASAKLVSTDRCGRKFAKCEPQGKLEAQMCFANTARIGQSRDGLVEVDYDDDGAFDGWTADSNLSRDFNAKPEYILNTAQRRTAECP
jgi:hypothetical protein